MENNKKLMKNEYFIEISCKIDKLFFSFYFTPSLLQNIHISLSILQDISIKYSFFINFFIIFPNDHTF